MSKKNKTNTNESEKHDSKFFERKAANILRCQVMPCLEKAIEAGVEENTDGEANVVWALTQALMWMTDRISTGEYTLTEESYDLIQELLEHGDCCEKIDGYYDKHPDCIGADMHIEKIVEETHENGCWDQYKTKMKKVRDTLKNEVVPVLKTAYKTWKAIHKKENALWTDCAVNNTKYLYKKSEDLLGDLEFLAGIINQ